MFHMLDVAAVAGLVWDHCLNVDKLVEIYELSEKLTNPAGTWSVNYLG
jgi:hypothetical protein